MKLLKVNFLTSRRAAPIASPNAARPAKTLLSMVFFIGIFVFSFGIGRLSLSETASAALANLTSLPLINQMHLIGSPDRRLAGEAEDRINILLLGMGGEGHEGPLLTDTIMVASIQPSQSKVALLSVPRDMLVPLPKAGWRKINAANAFGELQMPGRGAEFTRTALEGLLGLNIPYYVRVDFQGFQTLIDDIGGIDIYIERAFSDHAYPTSSHGVQTVAFAQGWQHLSGEEALRFARSRHGNNGEGSDFARAKRQQKVLAAVKEKTLTFSILKSPSRISNMLAELQSNITTNLQIGEILRLAKMGKSVDPGAIVHKVIDDGPTSPLVATNINGAYVLVPRKDDWSDLRDVAAAIFEVGESDIHAAAAPTQQPAKKPRIELQNGSGKSGLARDVAGRLSGFGFTVVKIGNANSFEYKKTAIYDLSGGKNPAARDDLRQALGGDVEIIVAPLPSGSVPQSNADFLVILGKNTPEQI